MHIHLRTVQFENVHNEILGNNEVMGVGKMNKEVIVLSIVLKF